jgi:hypothetical protein
MAILNRYVEGRDVDGVETAASREIINQHFTGERALFTGESTTNERTFKGELTFRDVRGQATFAPWHGKISHRYFRMHFVWPLPPTSRKLPVLYLGPKITKS